MNHATAQSAGYLYTVTVKATPDKVILTLDCGAEPALSQTWTYMREELRLLLISVAALDSTEIERDPVLRPQCRRIAMAAWQKACQTDSVLYGAVMGERGIIGFDRAG